MFAFAFMISTFFQKVSPDTIFCQGSVFITSLVALLCPLPMALIIIPSESIFHLYGYFNNEHPFTMTCEIISIYGLASLGFNAD